MSVLGKGSMTKFTFATSEEGFDNHIETSIRGYNNLWNDVVSMSKYFVEDHTNIVLSVTCWQMSKAFHVIRNGMANQSVHFTP